jgi:hypothetical protein
MPQVGFEPRIRVLERAKTVQALHRADTVIGRKYTGVPEIWVWVLKSSTLTIVHVGGETVVAIVAVIHYWRPWGYEVFKISGEFIIQDNKKCCSTMWSGNRFVSCIIGIRQYIKRICLTMVSVRLHDCAPQCKALLLLGTLWWKMRQYLLWVSGGVFILTVLTWLTLSKTKLKWLFSSCSAPYTDKWSNLPPPSSQSQGLLASSLGLTLAVYEHRRSSKGSNTYVAQLCGKEGVHDIQNDHLNQTCKANTL